MGSPNEVGDKDEHPQHTVTLDGFWMDQTEVTNAMYAQCVAVRACTEPVANVSFTRNSYYGNAQYDNYPVIYVNWNQAWSYCKWAGRALPTEAQWEKAARGTEGSTYPWGNQFDCINGNFDDETQATAYAVIGGPNCDGYVDTAPVGSYTTGTSPYGVKDMAGNVWEWVADWFGDYPSVPVTNPTGPDNGEYRVLRGGSWYNNVDNIRAAYREWDDPVHTGYYLGFRCSLNASETP